ncbi:hypothetical protein TNIN_365071 [Trichonephila inaurata madagascariensis]|uniref:Uncharacterized protein n=1 Tax=Trichonephila inaurata madagascariensis TaxID=2747483 RepID=A0A8X6IP46_9ARAC|nr:hypothetical protein TNIN_365071 [Trichonephila inaurata madagascariensis]
MVVCSPLRLPRKFFREERPPDAEKDFLRQFRHRMQIIYMVMSQVLPYGDFEWISPDTFNQEQILSIHENSEAGYVFEVDLEYPTELHNLQSD